MKKIWRNALAVMAMTGFALADTNATMLYDGGVNALLAGKKSFYVSIKDEVTGGCLPKPNQVKQSMEKALKKNGFKIIEKPDAFSNEIYISTLGFKNNAMCAVTLSVDMYFPVIVTVPDAESVPSGNKTYVNYQYELGSYIANYRRSQMQKQLNKIARLYADKIYMRISKAKDDIYPKFPSMDSKNRKSLDKFKKKQ